MIRIYDNEIDFIQRYQENMQLIRGIDKVNPITSTKLKKGKNFSQKEKGKEPQGDFASILKEKMKIKI